MPLLALLPQPLEPPEQLVPRVPSRCAKRTHRHSPKPSPPLAPLVPMRGVDVAADTGTVLGVGAVAGAAWVEHVLLEYLVRPIQTVGGTVKPGILAGLRSMSNWRPPSCCQFLA